MSRERILRTFGQVSPNQDLSKIGYQSATDIDKANKKQGESGIPKAPVARGTGATGIGNVALSGYEDLGGQIKAALKSPHTWSSDAREKVFKVDDTIVDPGDYSIVDADGNKHAIPVRTADMDATALKQGGYIGITSASGELLNEQYRTVTAINNTTGKEVQLQITDYQNPDDFYSQANTEQLQNIGKINTLKRLAQMGVPAGIIKYYAQQYDNVIQGTDQQRKDRVFKNMNRKHLYADTVTKVFGGDTTEYQGSKSYSQAADNLKDWKGEDSIGNKVNAADISNYDLGNGLVGNKRFAVVDDDANTIKEIIGDEVKKKLGDSYEGSGVDYFNASLNVSSGVDKDWSVTDVDAITSGNPLSKMLYTYQDYDFKGENATRNKVRFLQDTGILKSPAGTRMSPEALAEYEASAEVLFDKYINVKLQMVRMELSKKFGEQNVQEYLKLYRNSVVETAHNIKGIRDDIRNIGHRILGENPQIVDALSEAFRESKEYAFSVHGVDKTISYFTGDPVKDAHGYLNMLMKLQNPDIMRNQIQQDLDRGLISQEAAFMASDYVNAYGIQTENAYKALNQANIRGGFVNPGTGAAEDIEDGTTEDDIFPNFASGGRGIKNGTVYDAESNTFVAKSSIFGRTPDGEVNPIRHQLTTVANFHNSLVGNYQSVKAHLADYFPGDNPLKKYFEILKTKDKEHIMKAHGLTEEEYISLDIENKSVEVLMEEYYATQSHKDSPTTRVITKDKEGRPVAGRMKMFQQFGKSYRGMEKDIKWRKEEGEDAKRADGSYKSRRGFLGPLEGPDGKTKTEFSIGVKIGGLEVEIPSLVPTLNSKEIDIIKKATKVSDLPESIIVKAKEHAQKRISEGKSPFYQDGEEEVTSDIVDAPKVQNEDVLDLLLRNKRKE